MKRIIFSILCVVCCLAVCEARAKKNEKPKYLWFDAEANFERFSHKDSICYYLDKAKKTGFNTIVVDVRSSNGLANYKSEILPPSRPDADWDYLQFFIDECRKRKLEVCVSAMIFPAGRPFDRTGVVYNDSRWDGKTSLQYTPKGMLDIRNDSSKVAAFLNPILPEVQEYCLSFIKELVSNYDFDGFALDYCRYSGIESDFSDVTRKAFEAYIGESVPNFPADIFTWEKDDKGNFYVKDGKYAPLWYEFRSMVIHDFIKKTKEEIKTIKPDIRLEYWTASWHHGLYKQAQNWASKRYDPYGKYAWASPNYKNTGFAEHLDRFMNGAYLEKVYGLEDPESMEFAYEKGKKLIGGDNMMLGSIYALERNIMEDAAYVSLTQAEGLVVFDIVQVIKFDLWDTFKRAIDRAEKKKK